MRRVIEEVNEQVRLERLCKGVTAEVEGDTHICCNKELIPPSLPSPPLPDPPSLPPSLPFFFLNISF